MTGADWRIPPSVLHWLDSIPASAAVTLLLRHSVRDDLPLGDAGYVLPITDVGERLALELGGRIGARFRGVHASPLTRCVQTAEALVRGAGASLPVVPDRLLGDPGAFVIDGHRAATSWEALGHEAMMARLVDGDAPLPGMADADAAARFLVHHMLAQAAERPGLHIFVTHDSLVTATTARLLGEPLGPSDWPWYLEGAFFWRSGGRIHVGYRARQRTLDRTSLCGLEERDVIDFARRELAATVGSRCEARYILAGGAFKTLLTGRPPADLDVWASSHEDRALLVRALLDRGARQLPPRPYGDAFEIAGRVVEVPAKPEPGTLADRLARFDLALSAVAVEHLPGDRWRTLVHPLARTAVARREVLLLKPLVNWKYALATLDRARRYAEELGYHLPPEEEAEVWRIFEAQGPEMRQGMLDRYDRSAKSDHGVREEALCHLR